ncbi:MAG: cupin domain-containing protein [Oscillospiraceae bacterium]|nr:cupin domain-containing protein [Oscillospiraceae bacterium]
MKDYKTDYGAKPYATCIKKAAECNSNFRTALWSGKFLQMTLMCIPACCDIGLEVHKGTDQYIRVECGKGCVVMGAKRDKLDYECALNENSAVFVPAGTWHNIINTGNCPLKLSSIYAPPHHPHGTVHKTKCDAEKSEKAENQANAEK